MRLNQGTAMWRRAAGASGLAALLFTYGCGGFQAQAASNPQASSAAGAPVLVNCEPNQRAVIRPAATNGGAASQVDCVSVDQSMAAVQTSFVQPQLVTSRGPVTDAQLVPVASYPAASTVRPVRTTQIVERPVRRVERTRSVKKSAVIIGSSAGVGAGLGAAMGGKKGALVGALVGGGGAALWDQITR